MEFTEIDELNEMIIYSKSYKPSLIPKFNKFFDFDFKSAQDFNYISMDEMMDHSFDDMNPSGFVQMPVSKLVFSTEKQNETIEDILQDISNSLANLEINTSPLTSPKKKIEDETFMKPIQEVDNKKEGSFEAVQLDFDKNPEKIIEEEEMKDPYNEEKDDLKKTSSMEEKKNFLKLEKENVSQTFTEKRKITSCLSETMKNKSSVKPYFFFHYYYLQYFLFFFKI